MFFFDATSEVIFGNRDDLTKYSEIMAFPKFIPSKRKKAKLISIPVKVATPLPVKTEESDNDSE